jgi:predicted NBD/HSP70 family sugar kinase
MGLTQCPVNPQLLDIRKHTCYSRMTHPPLTSHSPHTLAPRYEQEAKKAIEAINAVMGHLGAAAMSVITDTNKLMVVVGGASALALGVYGARESTRVVGKAAERWLGTPKLVSGWVGRWVCQECVSLSRVSSSWVGVCER